MAVAITDISRALTLRRQTAVTPEDEEEVRLLDQLKSRKLSIESDQTHFAALCDHWDNLYFPQNFTAGGASHWAQHPSARLPGRSHVSLNVYPTYIDVPASLQAVPPIENMASTEDSDGGRKLAAAVERVYSAWKHDIDFDLKFHKGCVVKGLYGRTAAKVYWDAELGYPQVEVIDQPKNLYLGWRDSNYERLEWALYVYAITPMTAYEDWGLECREESDAEGVRYARVMSPGALDTGLVGANMVSADLRVEVYDYWYRRPAKNAKVKFGKPVKFETWNAIFVGNVMVKNKRHGEYRGALPYIPVMNTYIPGMPMGRPELYDIEQLVREKDERLSGNSQMIDRALNGQMWQLTGPTAPATVPPGLKPKANEIIAPGEGNRIEALQPWMPQFQVDQYLDRLDAELVEVSGLNDVLRGVASTQTLNSGKAISALVANYETRITMKRDLAYRWRLAIQELAFIVWAEKAPDMKDVIEGKARLIIMNPSLTPRDDLEAANIAASMKSAKIWSGARAMDRTGVDDPEAEMNLIRSEQTDATLNPAEVQVMAQLLGILKAQGIVPGQDVQNAVQGQASALADVRALAPGPMSDQSMNAPEEQAPLPNEQMPGNTPEGQAVGAGPLVPAQGGEDLTLQTAIREGEANSRILQQQRITRQPQG